MKVELSMTDNLSNEFTNLTAEEKKIALKILQEYAENGKSSTYDQVEDFFYQFPHKGGKVICLKQTITLPKMKKKQVSPN